MTAFAGRDWMGEHNVRVAWLKSRLRKAEKGMESEYKVSIDDVALFRMFRAPLNTRVWALVVHSPVESPVLRGMGFLFNVEGTRDRDQFRTREQVLSWIAIRWDDAIDRAMKAA